MTPALVAARLIDRYGRVQATQKVATRLRLARFLCSEASARRLAYAGARVQLWAAVVTACRRVAA